MSSSVSFIFYINAWLIVTNIFLFSGCPLETLGFSVGVA